MRTKAISTHLISSLHPSPLNQFPSPWPPVLPTLYSSFPTLTSGRLSQGTMSAQPPNRRLMNPDRQFPSVHLTGIDDLPPPNIELALGVDPIPDTPVPTPGPLPSPPIPSPPKPEKPGEPRIPPPPHKPWRIPPEVDPPRAPPEVAPPPPPKVIPPPIV